MQKLRNRKPLISLFIAMVMPLTLGSVVRAEDMPLGGCCVCPGDPGSQVCIEALSEDDCPDVCPPPHGSYFGMECADVPACGSGTEPQMTMAPVASLAGLAAVIIGLGVLGFRTTRRRR